jgi:hypothetical protein
LFKLSSLNAHRGWPVYWPSPKSRRKKADPGLIRAPECRLEVGGLGDVLAVGAEDLCWRPAGVSIASILDGLLEPGRVSRPAITHFITH